MLIPQTESNVTDRWHRVRTYGSFSSVVMLCVLLVGMMALGFLGEPASAETDPSSGGTASVRGFHIPLPKGALAMPGGPRIVRLGTRSLEVESFVVQMEERALVKFYERELTRAGWRLDKLPWQAQNEQATRRLARMVDRLRTRQDIQEAEKEEMETRFREMQDSQELMRQKIYASQGQEHVIVNLMPMGGSTAIFFNRWTGKSSLTGVGAVATAWDYSGADPGVQANPRTALYEATLRPTATAASVMQSDAFSTKNVCCSDAEVPGLEASLPFGVPRYPEARAAAQSEPMSGDRASIFLMTPDAPAEVVAYYRRQMPREGWQPLDAQRGRIGERDTVDLLRYQRADRICDITIEGSAQEVPQDQGLGEAAGEPVQTTIMISVALRASAGWGGQ